LVENGRIIVTSFEQASKNERKCLLDDAIHSKLAWKLMGLSGFLAEAAVNTDDESLIRAAILLHVIEDFRVDYRENYLRLALVAYASKMIDVDLKPVVMSVDYFASERAKKYLRDFVSRNDDLNRPESFGIKVEITDGLLRFVPVWSQKGIRLKWSMSFHFFLLCFHVILSSAQNINDTDPMPLNALRPARAHAVRPYRGAGVGCVGSVNPKGIP
jgi:hypothetical protein